LTIIPKYYFNIILTAFGGMLMSSCSSITGDSGVPVLEQGQIIYKISYPYLDSNDIGLSLLPKEMTLIFRGNQYKAESIGGMGLFAAGFISNNEEKTMDYFMKIISSKYVSRFTERGVKRFHVDFPSYRLEDLDSTRSIAGINCTATKVIFYNNVVPDYIIWHTNQIKLKNSNWCSPFPLIPGVLMEYQVQQQGLVLKMTVSSVESDSISLDQFKVPLDFNIVSNKTLTRKMKEAFMSFDY